MSLILDALNKSERDRRERQGIPDLQTEHILLYEADRKPAWSSRKILIAGLAMVLVLITVVSVLFKQSASIQPAVPATPTINPAASQPLAAIAEESDHSRPDNLSEGPAQLPGPETAQDNAPVYKLEEKIGALYQGSSVTLESVIPTVSHEADPPESRPQEVEDEIVPWLIELPSGIKDQIPSLRYGMHIFSDENADSFVVINDKDRRVGDSVATGVVLIAIDADSITLEFEEVRFRLEALNNWVNM